MLMLCVTIYAFTMPFNPDRDRSTEVADWFGKLKEENKETEQP